MPEASTSAAGAEAHGSAEVRSLSRKIKSCEACRKMKIKCVFPPGATICTRCENRSLQCKLSKNLQGILADDLAWKHELEGTLSRQQDQISKQQDQIAALQKTVDDLVRGSRLGFPRNSAELEDRGGQAKRRRIDETTPLSGDDFNANNSNAPRGEENSHSLLPLRATRQRETDVISRKLITLEEASTLLSVYLSEMDHHLFHIIRYCHISNPSRRPGAQLQQETVREWLEELRSSSSLLLLSLLSVAALHQPNHSQKFPLVYKEFIRLAAMMAFSQQHDLNDLRALVVGAFYLSDVSWILVGTAVRVATEQGLHLSYKTTPLPPHSGASEEEFQAASRAYEEARLYYFVYLVDHQASITPHGRPPMTRQHSGIRNCSEWLLRCCNANGVRLDDQRLISQVKLFEILHDTVDLLGTDATQPLDGQSLLLEQRFSSSLQEWLKESSLQISWSCSGEEEKERHLCEVRLHYSFAFLFLESFAYRAPPGSRPSELIHAGGSQLKEMASRAEATADSILQALSSGSQELGNVWSSIRFGPAYLYSMVISTIVFLVKVQESNSQEAHSLRQTLQKVNQALNHASGIAQLNCDQHLMRRFVDRSGELIRNLTILAQQNQSRASTNRESGLGGIALEDFASPTSQHSGGPSSSVPLIPNATGIDNMHANSLTQFGTGNQAAEIPGFTLDEFDLLSNTHSVSGLNLWSDIFENIDMNSAANDGSSLNSILNGTL